MFDHLGWHEAANKVRSAVGRAIALKKVTIDLATQIDGASKVGCKEFGETLIRFLE